MKPVIVISHERSGTHLCMNLVALNFGFVIGEQINMPPANSVEFFRELGSHAQNPKIIRKSHHQVEAFGEYVDYLTSHYAVIYVRRNVCAVMVSCWHYFNDNGCDAFPKCGSFDDFLKTDPSRFEFDKYYSVRSSRSMPMRWKIHDDSWTHVGNTLTLNFRELASNPTLAMLKVSSFIGIPIVGPMKIPEPGQHAVFFRKGRVDSWKEEITLRQQWRIEREIYE